MQRGSITLNNAFTEYLQLRRDLRPTTIRTYEQCYHHAGEKLGQRAIKDIRYSDIKTLYMSLKYDDGLSARSIELINSVLHPIFELAVRDGALTKNPAQGVLREVCRSDGWEKPRKLALTVKAQKNFMAYVNETPRFRRWSPLFSFLFGTGLRIGEATGLKWEDVDFDKGYIHVNRTMIYLNHEMIESKPKTKAGYRTIPILPEVEEALRQEQKNQAFLLSGGDFVPGPYVFLNSYGKPHLMATVNQAIENILRAYQRDYPRRDPIPHFSVHQMRHTFCTRLCENEVNIKVIQSVMGHSDIETTMNIYAEISKEKEKMTFKGLKGKIVL